MKVPNGGLRTFVACASVRTSRFSRWRLGSRYAEVAYERLAVSASIDNRDVMQPSFCPFP